MTLQNETNWGDDYNLPISLILDYKFVWRYVSDKRANTMSEITLKGTNNLSEPWGLYFLVTL